jgi:F0F1-type ATP synthase membrane subunit c/vacuolar-type H+-ATPase subunit K
MDGMARQPEMAARIQTGAIIFAALIEESRCSRSSSRS